MRRWSIVLGILVAAAGCAERAPTPKPAETAQAPLDTLGAAKDILFWKPTQQAPSYRHMDRIFPIRVFKRGSTPYPLPKASEPMPLVTYQFEGRTLPIDSFLVRTKVAAMLVIQDGKIRMERYLAGNDEQSHWISFSVGKSVVSTLVGAAIRDGAIKSIDDPVTKYLPNLAGSAYEGVTVRQLLEMSSGVRYNENYRDRNADVNTIVECLANRQAGCMLEAVKKWPRQAPAGSLFNYNTAETQMLGHVVAAATGKKLADYLSEKIWAPFGMEQDGYWILEGEDGPEFAGGGCNMTLRDWGRFGLFILNGGVANGKQVLPKSWVDQASRPGGAQVQYGKLFAGFPMGYGYLWWLYPPAGPSQVPGIDGAFAAEGVFGQSIHIDRKEKLVVATWSTWPDADGDQEGRESMAFMAGLTSTLKNEAGRR